VLTINGPSLHNVATAPVSVATISSLCFADAGPDVVRQVLEYPLHSPVNLN